MGRDDSAELSGDPWPCTTHALRLYVCTEPTRCFPCAVLVLHYATNYLFFNVLGFNYLAAAVAFTLSRFYYFLLQAAYIHWNGLGPRVWGTPSRAAFSDWGKFASLAYPSAAMRCMESVCYSGMTVLSGASPPLLWLGIVGTKCALIQDTCHLALG